MVIASGRGVIALVGPMGAGKSSVGRILARLLDKPFVDLDHAIEDHAGADIPLIFELEGEDGFRRREHAALLRELDKTDLVLACGGGVVLDARNRAALRTHAYVVHLVASVDQQLKRLARDRSRPLLQAADRRARLQVLAEQREALYADVADLQWRSSSQHPATVARELAIRLTGIDPPTMESSTSS